MILVCPFAYHSRVTGMPLISRFDPWKSSLCTCPPKLTINPYSGCDHNCVYCYASSYIPKFGACRPKKDLLANLKGEASKLRGEVISIANSSDPYPCLEANLGLTRKCLEILSKNDCRIQIITKSNIVTRDEDFLTRVPSSVALTITTEDENLAKLLEPNAPSPAERLSAAQDLIEKAIPVSVRIDPIIPFINDEQQKLITTLAHIGVKHLTSSTYKPKPDNWRRLAHSLPKVAEKIKPLYFQHGEKIGGNTLLPKEFRFKLLKNIHDVAASNGLKFGVCREDLSQLNTAACDGSWLIPTNKR
jgi:DNA repair photolyase